MQKRKHAQDDYTYSIRADQMVGATEAARSLSRQIDRAKNGEKVFILKNNAVAAVLMGEDEYKRLRHSAEVADRLEIAN